MGRPFNNQNKSQGTSLVELMVGMAILPVLIFAVMSMLDTYNEASVKARDLGINEDARTFVRTNLDCRQTALREGSICKLGGGTGGYIRGYDATRSALSSNAEVGRDFDGTKVRLHCSNDGISLNIRGEIKMRGEADYKSLEGVPISCKICSVDVASLPATFPPAPIAAGPHRLLGYLNTLMTECGEPTIPGNSILHSTGGGSRRGKDKPFIIGTIHEDTMIKVCNMLGFATYVGSSCVEDDGDDYRCNYTSPGDNGHVFWNGTSWSSTGNPSYYMSWLSQITCTDPM